MFYSGENPVLRIMAVEHLCWGQGSVCVPPREYASLTFRIRGEATVCCGEHTCHVNTNEILYVPQNLSYTASYTDTELLAIHFVTDSDDPVPESYALQSGENLYKMFLHAHALWEKKQPAYGVLVMSQLYGILGELCEKETSVHLPPHFLNAVSFLNANFKEDISIAAVCREAGIGGTTFRQLFREYYQKTPMEYLVQLRLEYARNLIAGGMAIEQAALESGFHDSKYFARTVKKHFGCTPRELKKYGK